MPEVKVRYFAFLRELIGNIKEEKYDAEEGTMLMDLLLKYIPKRHQNMSRKWKERIFETDKDGVKFDKDGTPSIKGYYLVLINGRQYSSILEGGRHHGLRYKLKNGDDIAILPPVGGG